MPEDIGAPMQSTQPDPLATILLFAVADLEQEPAGRAALQALGLDGLALKQLLPAADEEQLQAARRRALAARLVDAPRLGAFARAGLGEALAGAQTPRDWALLSLALARLPEWTLESARERAGRLAAQNDAMAAATGASRRPGARARSRAGSDSRGGSPLYAPAAASLDEEQGWFDPIERVDGVDRDLIETLLPFATREAEQLTGIDLYDTLESAWDRIAQGRLANCEEGMRLASGHVISPEAAQQRVADFAALRRAARAA